MSWYLESGPDSDVVISTRVRFARNIEDIKFTPVASQEELEKVIEIFEKREVLPKLKLYRLLDMDDITKKSLVEKHIISPDMLKGKEKEKAILLSEDETISIMINEEDHLRIQVISAGFDLEETLKIAQQVDEKIANMVTYAYDENYGYLTSCPTNVGTGMRASVMVHLPGLTMTNHIGKVLDVVNKIGMNIRGIYGEGSKALGNIYQISNQIALGVSEEEIMNQLKTICQKVMEQERYARKYLLNQGLDLEDKLYRSYGMLISARKLSTTECMELLSDVKLGVDLGLIKEMDGKKVNELQLLTKPASLQKYFGKVLTEEERDRKRTELIRESISK